MTKKQKEMQKAFEKLFSMPPPQFDMEKIRAELAKHHRTCGLCKLLGFRTLH